MSSIESVVRHFVAFRFKDNITDQAKKEAIQKFLDLKQLCVNPTTKLPYIVSIETGKAISPEGCSLYLSLYINI